MADDVAGNKRDCKNRSYLLNWPLRATGCVNSAVFCPSLSEAGAPRFSSKCIHRPASPYRPVNDAPPQLIQLLLGPMCAMNMSLDRSENRQHIKLP